MKTPLPERNLDVLRAIAVLCVLADHFLTVLNLDRDGIISRWEIGRMGVLLFFVHTSLVLMSSLEREGPRPDWVRAFYLRRALRIYPLAIATVLLVVLLRMPPSADRVVTNVAVAPTWVTVASNLTLTENLAGKPDVLSVLWSLPLEMQMYVLLPLGFLLARRGVGVVFGAVSVAAVAGLIDIYSGIPGVWRLNITQFVPCFLGGILAFAILRKGRRPALPSWCWPLLICACVPLFALLRPGATMPERGWLFCLGVGCAIPLAANLPKSFFTRVAHVICTYSYGIYLLHLVALWVGFTVLKGMPWAVQWGTCVVLLFALPWAFYHLIERPGIQLGKRLVAISPRSSSRGESRPTSRDSAPELASP
ncbi:MAG TPA: acyltransferase [Gemmatimonadales bacterium]|nr:acyltransferase [Gemmatimonadales bacterium]